MDRCGKILNEIGESYPDWVVSNSVSPQGAALISIANGCVLNFSSTAIDLSLRRDLDEDPISEQNVIELHKQIDEMTTLICDRLDVIEALRIGFRMVFCIPMRSKENAASEVKLKNFWKLNQKFLGDLGGSTSSEAMTIEFEQEDASFRLAIQSMERKENVKMGSKKHAIRIADYPKSQRPLFLDNRGQAAKNVANSARKSQNEKWSVPYLLVIDVDGFIQDPPAIDASNFSQKMASKICELGHQVGKGYTQWQA